MRGERSRFNLRRRLEKGWKQGVRLLPPRRGDPGAEGGRLGGFAWLTASDRAAGTAPPGGLWPACRPRDLHHIIIQNHYTKYHWGARHG